MHLTAYSSVSNVAALSSKDLSIAPGLHIRIIYHINFNFILIILQRDAISDDSSLQCLTALVMATHATHALSSSA